MSRYSAFEVARWVTGAALLCACSGKPAVDIDGQNGQLVKPGTSGATTANPDAGVAGTGQISTGGPGVGLNGETCKTTCEVGDCGPIVDPCTSQVIECGGCTLPETCGGAGIPSHCGDPSNVATCVPKTCQELGATCGQQGDGCGGIVDCWSAEAKAAGTPACTNPAELCINGTCTSTAATCKKLTCADYAGNPSLCGVVSDGCSGVLNCGFTCAAGEGCIDSKCTRLCTPQTCQQALAKLPQGYCDVVPDGCGGIIQNCGTVCASGETCGGGQTPGICGTGNSTTCVPKTVADCTDHCGVMGDGCGGTVTCPTTCLAGETCGGNSAKPGQCGVPGAYCAKTSCNVEGGECGTISDKCDGFLDCGTCAVGFTCGANNRCVALPPCTPKTAAELCVGKACGPISDGCCSTVDCGGCTVSGETCGGGGPSLCGVQGGTCVPKTQQEACAHAKSCGPQSDGCGGSLPSCGTCTWPERCIGTPTACTSVESPSCTNLCPYIDTSCAAQSKTPTRLTGKVYAPNGTEPLYNALVYVPNEELPRITTGATCERCLDEDLGKPIAAALTQADGSFILNNVPAGKSFPLVVKMGKWRRVVTIPAVTNCSSTALTSEQTRLPKNMNDADATNKPYINIPHFAIVTGAVDAIECVMRKIGVSDSEFTLPTASQSGRIHMYRAPMVYGSRTTGGGGTMGCKNFKTSRRGATSTTQCASEGDADVIQAPLADLFATSGTATKLSEYDIAVFDCEGDDNEHNTYDAVLRDWANVGGRVFASHYSYTYLRDDAQFKAAATWGGSENNSSSTTGIIDKSFPKGLALNTWLGNVGGFSPTYGDGYISISDPRDYVKSVNASSERFIYTDTSVRVNNTQVSDANAIQEFSFNTPYGETSNICGRVLYSAFHVAGVSGVYDKIFPSYCSTGPLTAQEKVLEFMIFDLSACVSVGEPPAPPSCLPKTCSELGATCGSLPDGCGNLLNCGTCVAPLSCGGGGTLYQCGNNCTRTTCGAQGANCGTIPDGCGSALNCGTCTAPATCGGGGTPNVCGAPVCTPRTCDIAGAQCGYISDGCGNAINCGTCTTGVCGGSGTPNVCGTGTCQTGTCGTAKCGYVSDGCGDALDCGTCATGQTCVAGVCTGGTCTKTTCQAKNAACGFIGDGCGGILDCGDCVAPQVCGGGGIASQCGGSCTPRTCDVAGASCGAISDNCGGIKECGVCPTGQVCGGGGIPNKCGAGACTPTTCGAVGAECGSIGDGCGAVIASCGTCPVGQACVANKCTTSGGCVPKTCQDQGANCGPVADGCGGLLDCGTCVSPKTCGGGGIASQCGGGII